MAATALVSTAVLVPNAEASQPSETSIAIDGDRDVGGGLGHSFRSVHYGASAAPGKGWPVGPDDEPFRIRWSFNAGSIPEGLDPDEAHDAVQGALASWSSPDDLGFEWSEEPVVEIAVAAADQVNAVWWDEPAAGETYLGRAYIWRDAEGYISEFDIRLNNRYSWSVGSPVKGSYDLGTVMLHEVGHVLGFAHVDDEGAVMYPRLAAGVSQRTLGEGDLARLFELYDVPSSCQLRATISGTDGDDVLVGTSRSDVIWAGAGDDWVSGLEGDDEICGGRGNDILVGGPGSDLLEGGSGLDSIDGGAGDDRLLGGSGPDKVVGGDGEDELYGGPGADQIFGGRGRDRLHGGGGDDHIEGGRGADRLSGGSGADRLIGNAGADQLRGNSGADVLIGGRGNDKLRGGAGADKVRQR